MRLLCFLTVVIVLMAGCSAALAQTTTFDFLRVDVSARASALGGSFLTMANDPNLIFYNPAGLGSLASKKVSFGYFQQLVDIKSGHASFAEEIPGLGFVGAGIVYTNYGEFQGMDEQGIATGTFRAGDLAISAGYANRLREDLFYGAAVKYIFSSIDNYTSSGVAVDFGANYVALPGRIVLAASVLNLGTQFNPYMNTREALPLNVKVGARLTPEHFPAAILFDIHDINESQNSFFDHLSAFSIGMEFSSSENLQLRVGYNNQQRKDFKVLSSSGLAGLSFGAGLLSEPYTFDYAFNSMGKIGGLHRVTVGISF